VTKLQTHLIREEKTIRKTIKALAKFVSESDVYRNLGSIERQMLFDELRIRRQLVELLAERIRLFHDT
jgi:hypothetical protein